MSHELRTPLNSLLILAKMLSDNKEGNLNNKQTEYARTIQSAGTDLMNLINEVLDSIEGGGREDRDLSGRGELADVERLSRRSFRPVAQQKGLEFHIEHAAMRRWSSLPMVSDSSRFCAICWATRSSSPRRER